MKRDYRLYIDDLIEAIERIEKYAGGLSFEEFSRDTKTVDAVIRNFEVLGEAAKHIPRHIKNRYVALPWKEMAGMRDKLIQEYFGIKLKIVWKTINKRLPQLKRLLKEILKDIEAKGEF